MKIKKMTATFGALQNQTIELNDGLNVITAPNESGKSTWCSFIKAMLYGIDSSAREKNGIKPDKAKFAPWSGESMSGSMQVEFEGRDMTLTRRGNEKAPLRELTATLTGTGESAGLGANPGETLTGVSREVFERSAFIGQGAVTVGASAELEKRIASIVQTGEEGVSCTEAVEKLRAGMRHKKFNNRGEIPEIEAEIAAERSKIAEIEAQSEMGEQLRLAKTRAVENRDALTERVAESRKEGRKAALERLTGSRNAVRELETELSGRISAAEDAQSALRADYFGAKPMEECSGPVEVDLARLGAIDAELDNCTKKGGNRATVGVFAALFVLFAVLAYAGLAIFDETVFFWVGYVGAAGAVIFALLAIVQLGRMKRLSQLRAGLTMERENLFTKYNCTGADEIEAMLHRHGVNLRALDETLAARRETESRLAQEKATQEKLDAEMLKDLDFSESGESAALTRQLAEAEEQLRRVREQAAQWEGRFSALGDRRAIEGRIAELSERRDKLVFEYEALELASDTLTQAGAEIQNRMTPVLSRRSAELFAKLTDGRYDALTLDRQLKAVAKPAENSVGYDSAFLSVGAIDQLYLAVRLAICELALDAQEKCPLILDDALVNFDDERCLAALRLLKEESADRQVILFTCHSREAKLLSQL